MKCKARLPDGRVRYKTIAYTEADSQSSSHCVLRSVQWHLRALYLYSVWFSSIVPSSVPQKIRGLVTWFEWFLPQTANLPQHSHLLNKGQNRLRLCFHWY